MAVLSLLTVGIFIGFLLGLYFKWPIIVVSSIALAILSAVVLQKEDFDAVAGIAIIILCLVIHQIGYLIGSSMPPYSWD